MGRVKQGEGTERRGAVCWAGQGGGGLGQHAGQGISEHRGKPVRRPGAGMSLCLKQGKESSVLWPKWSEGERWRGEKGSRQITWAVWAAVGSFRFFLRGMGSY